jgi:hypothetical protein
MRHLIAITAASLSVAACSSAPTGSEPVASATAAQEFCPVGTKPVCSSPNDCKCVDAPPTPPPPLPPVCSFDVPTPPPSGPQYDWWVEAWATTQNADGQCPDVTTPTGTWSNVDPSYYFPVAGCFSGVPCVSGDPNLPPPSCSGVYGSTPCCTYVWWPAGFVLEAGVVPDSGCYAAVESSCDSYPNDSSALCTVSGQTFTALENTTCVPVDGDKYPCGRPGGSSCAGSCSGI